MQRKSKMVDVAQSVRASDCGSEGRRFETDLPPRWNGELNFDSPFFYFFSVGENGNSDENGSREKLGGSELNVLSSRV